MKTFYGFVALLYLAIYIATWITEKRHDGDLFVRFWLFRLWYEFEDYKSKSL